MATTRPHPNCGRSGVLTEPLVRRIKQLRRDYRFGPKSISDLLAEDCHTVKPATIRDVLDGKTWGWLAID